jgi:hypothetical protein
MKVFIKILKAIGIVVGIMTLFTILDSLSARCSLFYWMCASVMMLPILFWKGWRFGVSAIFSTLIAVALAVSPVDFVFQRGNVGFIFFRRVMALQPSLARLVMVAVFQIHHLMLACFRSRAGLDRSNTRTGCKA